MPTALATLARDLPFSACCANFALRGCPARPLRSFAANRPLADRAVAEWTREWGRDTPLDQGTKRHVLDALGGRYIAADESRTLFNHLNLTAQSLARVLTAGEKKLVLPELNYAPPKKGPVGVSLDVGLGDVRSAG